METKEQESKTTKPYWTVERLDGIIENLRSKYNPESEDSAEVSALLEFRKVLKLLRVHD